MTGKVYKGFAATRGVEVHEPSGGIYRLDPRFDLYRHSPDGFMWGYGGSGPSQLALALAADVTGDDARAIRIYQTFKQVYVATVLDMDKDWTADESMLDTIIKEAERDHAPPDYF